MRITLWILFSFAIVLMTVSFISYVVFDYSYNKNFGQYLKLADDASTADVKLTYFKQYRDAVNTINRENAAYVFQQKQYTKSEQLKILDTLIIRLEETNKMNPASFEYQQAMYQISGQEFNHTLERIDDIFSSCYIRTIPYNFLCIFIWWLVLPIIIIWMICLIYVNQ